MTLDPTIGRWMSEDPEGFRAADANLYRYVRNDPTNLTDPTGLDPNVTWKEVFPPLAGNSGAFIWPIKWSLEKGAGSGTIMQRIDVKVNIMQPGAEGGGSSPAPWGATLKGPDKGQVFKHWYETWQVTNGKVDDESAILNNKDFLKQFQQDFPDTREVTDSGGPLKGFRRKVPFFGPNEITVVANDWFAGANAGRVPGKAEPRKTWGYISVTAQARFYPGMTSGDLTSSSFAKFGKGWSGSGYLLSFAWSQETPEGEKRALEPLTKDDKIFSPGRFTKFEDIPSTDLTIRRFIVYWNADGATTILRGKEAEDANLEEIMKTLRPKP